MFNESIYSQFYIILNRLIKSSGKCIPKTKTYFFSLSISGIEKVFLEIWIRTQNACHYDSNRLLWIGEKNFTGNLKCHLWRRSLNVELLSFFKRFNFFNGNFKGFCLNILELLLREICLSVILHWNLWLFFVRLW